MSAEQTEKQIFRNILLKKPAWQGLAGSELEDIITSYVGQRAEAVLFEIERGRQENFLQLARDRESILAGAEAEGYVPVLPKPLRMEVKITNEGPNPLLLDSLLSSPRPLELIADDETKLLLGDTLFSVEGPPPAETEEDETSETDEEEDGADEDLEPENTLTKISKETLRSPIDSDASELSLITLAPPADNAKITDQIPKTRGDSDSSGHLAIIAQELVNEESRLYFRLFDKYGNVVFNSNEIDLEAKKDEIKALKTYLSDLWEIGDLTADQRFKIIEYFSSITDYLASVETKQATVVDIYSAGKTVETVTETTLEMTAAIDLDTDQTSQTQKAVETVAVTKTETQTDDDGASVTVKTVTRTNPETEIITETVTKNETKASIKVIDPNTGHVTETLFDKADEGDKTTIESFVDSKGARIRTEAVSGNSEITVEESIEEEDKLIVTVMKRPDYSTPGRIVSRTITYIKEGARRYVEMTPYGEVLESGGEISQSEGKITRGEAALDGEVKIIETDGATTETVRTTENNNVTFTITYPDGKTHSTITADGVKTTIETDPDTGAKTTSRIDAEGNKTVEKEFGSLPPGGAAMVNAKQLWKEVRYFHTSPEPEKVFQEFIVGGAEEHGDFTIHDFEVEINGEKWRKERNFLNGGPDSKIYHVYYRLSDELAFRLGDGEVGEIPPPESGVKVTVWHTSGDRVFMTPGQDITQLVDTEDPTTLTDQEGEVARLAFVGGRVLENGQPLENVESVRKSALSHIQVGGVAARNVDYEYKIRRRFPALLYLKVWGEKEEIAHSGHNPAHINRAFFTFLIELEDGETEKSPDYKARVDNVRTAIEDYFNGEIKPMNVEPQYKELSSYGFGLEIEGAIDRVYPDISVAEQEIKDLLTSIFGRDRSEKNFLRKFAYSDKRDKFMELFQRYSRLNGRANESDIYDALRESEYFRDAQPHLHRRNRPYYEIKLTLVDEAPPENDFFNQYVYLDPKSVDFVHKDNNATADGLCYADNF